jgi:hypothetical protein
MRVGRIGAVIAASRSVSPRASATLEHEVGRLGLLVQQRDSHGDINRHFSLLDKSAVAAQFSVLTLH